MDLFYGTERYSAVLLVAMAGNVCGWRLDLLLDRDEVGVLGCCCWDAVIGIRTDFIIVFVSCAIKCCTIWAILIRRTFVQSTNYQSNPVFMMSVSSESVWAQPIEIIRVSEK